MAHSHNFSAVPFTSVLPNSFCNYVWRSDFLWDFFRTAVHHTVCFSSCYLDQSTQETSLLAAAFALLPESQTCQIGFLCSITQNKFDELKTVSFELDFRRFLYRERSWVRPSVLRGCLPDFLLNLRPLSGMLPLCLKWSLKIVLKSIYLFTSLRVLSLLCPYVLCPFHACLESHLLSIRLGKKKYFQTHLFLPINISVKKLQKWPVVNG